MKDGLNSQLLSPLKVFQNLYFAVIFIHLSCFDSCQKQILVSTRMQVLRKYYYIKQFISFTGASLLLVAFGPTYLAESTANARYRKHFPSLALNGVEHPVMPISSKLQALHFFSLQPFFFFLKHSTEFRQIPHFGNNSFSDLPVVLN